MNKKAFTLAEFLITLGIIGVVAAMTIPVLLNKADDAKFKSAYKKAYSELSQIFLQAIQEQSFESRGSVTALVATASEWSVIQNGFKVAKACDINNLNNCWAVGDQVCTGSCSGGGGAPAIGWSNSFIDASGRSWAEYTEYENIFLVDTNGFTGPNRFGKDRWMFMLQNADGSRATVKLPAKVGILIGDCPTSNDWCTYAPCYYQSWLFN